MLVRNPMYGIGKNVCIGLVAFVIGSGIPTTGFSDEPERQITTIATVGFPYGVLIDPNGDIIVSHDGRAISRIDKSGTLHHVAGGTEQGFKGDGTLASQALLYGPGKSAFDRQGNLFVPDMGNHRVRKIDYQSGVITTVVGHGPTGQGKGSFGGDGGVGLDAFLNQPVSVAFDSAGALYIADGANWRIRKVTPGADGIITGAPDEIINTIAGIGKRGYTRDKKLALTARVRAVDVVIDSADHLFLLDSKANRVRRVDKDTGIITTAVGGGFIGRPAGFSGDGFDGWHAHMSHPEGMVFDSAGNLYIADTLNHRIRMVTPGLDGLITGKNQADEIIMTIAGSGSIGSSVGEFKGDGGSALQARLNRPKGVAIDVDGNLVIADGRNHRLRRVIMHPDAITRIHASQDTVVSPRSDARL